MNEKQCKKCGAINNSKRYFCEKCGDYLDTELLINSKNAEQASFQLSRIASNIDKIPHVDVLWDSTVDEYARKIERIQSLAQLQDLGFDSLALSGKMNKFLKLCRSQDFEIAFVGAVKAGKSTLINAILGRNYASTDPNPETAVLSKFRSSSQDYVKVKFYNKEEWNQLWQSVNSNAEAFIKLYNELQADKVKQKWIGHTDYLVNLKNDEIEDELKRWSSSHSPEHFFVKEIEVGISTLSKDFPKQVVLVDTPGLFDPVAYRSQISIDYVEKANAVLVCVKAEDLHGEEVKTLESVFSFSGHRRDKVFIVATNWDKLNNIITDWDKRYSYLIDQFTGSAFYPNANLAKRNILYASSYYYNLCRDFEYLSTNDKNKLMLYLMKSKNDIESCLEEKYRVNPSFLSIVEVDPFSINQQAIDLLKQTANIDYIRNMIITELVNQYKSLLLSDIKVLYDDIIITAKRDAKEKTRQVNSILVSSERDLDDIKKALSDVQNKKENMEKISNQLMTAFEMVKKSTQQRLTSILAILGETK